MPKTHPYLKGLAETRARADDEYLRTAALLETVTFDLEKQRKRLEHHCIRLENAVTSLRRRAENASTAREACDRLIQKFDQRLDPTQIAPINGWQGRYGKCGALGAMVRSIVENAYPEGLSTRMVAQALQDKLGLIFVTERERNYWLRNTVANRLDYIFRAGAIGRFYDSALLSTRPGWWHAIPSAIRQKGLAELAAEAGLTLSQASEHDFALAAPTIEEDDLPR